MKVKYIIKGLVASFLVVVLGTSCDSYNEALLDGIGNSRVFSPVNVKATVRNQTSVELNWTVNEQADHYVVEFSADDPNFSTIFKTVEVTGAELPVQVVLEGETLYSIRVKAVSASGLESSKWTVVTANTLSEQLFLAVQDGDIASKEATLRWVANSSVTQIVLIPGDITHIITAEEKISGIATVKGLSPETNYQANLFNNTKKRGALAFTTGIDIGDGILVKNTEDLLEVIENADSGAQLFLESGDYKSFGADGVTPSTDMILKKSITISAIPGKAKPVLHYKITANAGTNNISLLNLDLDGSGITNASVITIGTSGSNYGDFLISGCIVHDYTRSLLSASTATGSKVKSLTVDNSIVKNVNTNIGADFIDFRNSYVADIVLKNSTFDTCSTGRDFVRTDAAAGLTGTGLTTNVLIDSCTLYKVSDTAAPKRILYVRFGSNTSIVRNTLITSTTAIYTNQSLTITPTFTNNYYFGAPSFQDATIASNKVDASGTTLDPQFVNAASGDFTIKNQTMIDDKIGDPRWIN
ncbi:DUF5123 domain-containing protein [Flavobacterium piscis]|uniref:Fibronectin type-III domain-containing protein n=1 Tax=Flavobacterium piscis TaxID=1114874 RepID=A0ABU1Y3E4_9FLAO|nr:DUF5123 domain-containing protein [Flavobacterium piscis]MDR7208748.1 hypothetical protein [Flavobacterium piscis]